MAEQTSMPIAVVAMACRLPGDANNPKQFWENLIEKRDAWVEVPKERFNIDSFYNPVVEAVTGGSVSNILNVSFLINHD
jgi:acyl transferase domain-containing protein